MVFYRFHLRLPDYMHELQPDDLGWKEALACLNSGVGGTGSGIVGRNSLLGFTPYFEYLTRLGRRSIQPLP
nr:hypothetical protein Q903MT_gene1020 [Picea sitchensis]